MGNIEAEILKESQAVVAAIDHIKHKSNIIKWRKNLEKYILRLVDVGVSSLAFEIECRNVIGTASFSLERYYNPTKDEKDLGNLIQYFNNIKEQIGNIAKFEKKLRDLLKIEYDKAEFVEKHLKEVMELRKEVEKCIEHSTFKNHAQIFEDSRYTSMISFDGPLNLVYRDVNHFLHKYRAVILLVKNEQETDTNTTDLHASFVQSIAQAVKHR